MDQDAIMNEIQELREFRAMAEPELERIAKKQDDQSGKLSNINIELAELRVDLHSFKSQVISAIANVKWWIALGVGALGIYMKWSGK